MIYIIVINLFLQLMHLTFRKEVAQRKKVLFRILFPTLFFQFLDAFPLRFRCNGHSPYKQCLFTFTNGKTFFFPLLESLEVGVSFASIVKPQQTVYRIILVAHVFAHLPAGNQRLRQCF